MTANRLQLTSNGYAFNLAPDYFGELRVSNDVQHDADALRRRMADDGYLFLRGALDVDRVLAARRELLERFASVGLVSRDHALMDAIYSGDNSGLAGVSRKEFAKALRTGPAVRELCHQGHIIHFFERFYGGAVLPFSYIWARNVRVGAATGVHFDWVYMGRGTRNLHTAWIPLGDVPLSDGPLAVLEHSHRNEALQQTYGQLDVDRDKGQPSPYLGGWLSKDVNDVQARVGGRWLTANFKAGDLLVFGMFLLHCSLDNQSPVNRIRLSLDARYQLASEPADERWTGEDPFGHGMD